MRTLLLLSTLALASCNVPEYTGYGAFYGNGRYSPTLPVYSPGNTFFVDTSGF